MAQRKIPLFFLQFTLHVWSFLDMHEMTQVIDFLCAHFRQCCKQRAVSRLGLGKINPHLVHTTFSFFLVQSLVLLANSIANAFVFHELFFAIQFSSKQFFWRIIFRKLRKIIFNLNQNFQFQLCNFFLSKMISIRISSMPINFVIYQSLKFEFLFFAFSRLKKKEIWVVVGFALNEGLFSFAKRNLCNIPFFIKMIFETSSVMLWKCIFKISNRD